MGPQNNDELSLNEQYSFLTGAFFGDILQKSHEDCASLKVTNYDVDAALPKGENFCSQIVRATVDYSVDGGPVQTTKLILKLSFTKDSLNAKVQEQNMFEKEIICFTEILPQVEGLLRGIGDDVKLAAKCYATGQQPKYLCFEDLVAQGYDNVDKNVGFLPKHLEPLFTKLAKYHAGTAKLLLDNKFDRNTFMSHAFLDMSGIADYMETVQALATDEVAQWEGFEEITAKLRLLQPDFEKHFRKAFERDLDGFLVLSHGDLWSNNVMFKLAQNGDVEDVLMCDFQISCWCNPTHDLVYAIYMSGNYKMTEEELDTNVQNYHRVLTTTLKALDFPMKKAPTLRQLRADMAKRSFLGLLYMLQMNAFRGKKLTFDLDNLMDNSETSLVKKRKLFARPEFRKYSEPWLRYMDRKGLLDSC